MRNTMMDNHSLPNASPLTLHTHSELPPLLAANDVSYQSLRHLAQASGRQMVVHASGDVMWASFCQVGNAPLPDQGWKVHVSCCLTEMERFAEAVVKPLLTRKQAFKVAATKASVEALNSGQAEDVQAGKILTIYPETDQVLREICTLVQELWPKSMGPALRSDRWLTACRHIGIRYGIFSESEVQIDMLGRRINCLRRPDGSYEEE
jgi:hypothetical protein